MRRNSDLAVPFHWSDWTDLLALDKYILLPAEQKSKCKQLFDISGLKGLITDSDMLPVNEYCEDNDSDLGFAITKFPKAHTRGSAKLLAKLHLYLKFPTPAKLVFLTNSKGSYSMEVQSRENDPRYSLLNNGMVEELYAGSSTKSINVLDSYKLLLERNEPSTAPAADQAEVDLLPEWFHVDYNATIAQLRKLEVTVMEKRYLESLENSINTKLPSKSFNEAKLLNTDSGRVFGDHYDWRFFNGITLHTDAHTIALHRLQKNYLQFCRTHGLVTWIAHGSLLLWYWNGMSFPWDSDIDTQMPIRDLNRLAREFNQTLVVENIGHDYPEGNHDALKLNGMSAYFIDVGNTITHRENGNGNNNIDARFIDIHTGLYVDITGYSVSEEKAPARYDYITEFDKVMKGNSQVGISETELNIRKQTYNCRNRHFSSLTELSPLVMTVIQNQVGYVPKNFGMMLNNEYNIDGLIENNFEYSFYLPSMRLWANTDMLVAYSDNKEEWKENPMRHAVRKTREATYEEKNQINQFKADDHANLLNSNWILRQYLVGKNFTLFHENQMKLLLRNNMRKYNQRMFDYIHSGKSNRPMWDDSFMSKVAIHGWDYDAEVARLRSLSEMYATEAHNMAQKFQEEEKQRTEALEKESDRLILFHEEKKKAQEEKKKAEDEKRKAEEEKKKAEDEKKKAEQEKEKSALLIINL